FLLGLGFRLTVTPHSSCSGTLFLFGDACARMSGGRWSYGQKRDRHDGGKARARFDDAANRRSGLGIEGVCRGLERLDFFDEDRIARAGVRLLPTGKADRSPPHRAVGGPFR